MSTTQTKHSAHRPGTAKAVRNGGRSAVVDRSKWPICAICHRQQMLWDEDAAFKKSEGGVANTPRPEAHPVKWYIQMSKHKDNGFRQIFVCPAHVSIVESEAGEFAYDEYNLYEASYDENLRSEGKEPLRWVQKSGRVYNKGVHPAVMEDGSLNENAWVPHTLDNEHKS